MEKNNISFSQPQAFLEDLFSQPKGLIQILAIHATKKVRDSKTGKEEARSIPSFFKSVDKIRWDELKRLNEQDYNIYFGVLTRKEERGDKSAIFEMPCIWADVDAKHFESKQAAWDHIQRIIASTGLEPTYIIDSGHGYHIYFLFKEFEVVETLNDIARLEGYVKGVGQRFCGDHTHNLNRLMRLPGFSNMKDPSNPKPCEIVSSNPERRYNLSDFDIYWVEVKQVQADTNFEITDVPEQIPQRFCELLKKDKKLLETWEGRREDLTDNSGSGKDMALADALIEYGFTDAEAARILMEAPYPKGNDRTEAYLRHTIAKAKALKDEKDAEKAQGEQEKENILNAARQAVSDLAEKTKTDAGAPFEHEAIQAMRILRDSDPPLFARILDDLKKIGVSRRELYRQLNKETNAETECENEDEANGIYSVRNNVICIRKNTEAGTIYVSLCNFNARITSEKTVDDGAERKTVFTIVGVKSERQLPPIQVSAERFSSMNWVTSEWGGEPIVYAGFGTKDHLRVAIQVLSGEHEHCTVFAHLGWRRIGDRWYFLHGSGGIREDGLNTEILVDLSTRSAAYTHFRNYILPPQPTGSDLKKAIEASHNFLNVAPKTITYILHAAVYRAPLSEAAPVDFSIFLAGQTGSQKTELTALAQAHYGAGFHAKSLPGNWSSTDNLLEKQAFVVKDSIFTIDDFAPSGTTSDVQHLHRKADRILRAQGNLAGRGRMRSDGSFQPEYFPRGLIIASGEDIPRGQSLRSRMMIVEVSKGDVDLEKLTKAQKDSVNGLLAQAMAGYIQWLAPQIDDLKKTLPARQRELRTEARKWGVVHDRTPDIVASLAIGCETSLQFAEESGAISADEADKLWVESWMILNQVAKMQSSQILSEEPTQRFLDLLVAAISSGLAHIADINTNDFPYKGDPENLGWRKRIDGSEDWSPTGKKIGWLDGKDLFLDPESTFAVVQELTRQQGTSLPITQRTMWKRLDEKGLLASRESSQKNFTIRKEIAKTRKRVLHLKTQDVLGYKSSPSSPNSPETENTEEFGQLTSCQSPPRRKRSGPQSSPNGQESAEASSGAGTETTDNGSDATETGSQTTDYPSSGPVWTTGQEEVVQEKVQKTSEKHGSGLHGLLRPLFREDSPPGFNKIKEGEMAHGEFCDCTECCPDIDPWKG